MRKLLVIEFVTLDGVMQGLGSPDVDFWPSQPDDSPMAAHLNATPK